MKKPSLSGEALQLAAKRRVRQKNNDNWFKEKEQGTLVKPKAIPTNVIKPPATLIPSGVRKLPDRFKGNPKAIMEFLKKVGTSA